jgi:hypothetical protein
MASTSGPPAEVMTAARIDEGDMKDVWGWGFNMESGELV